MSDNNQQEIILNILGKTTDPFTNKDFGEKAIKDITVDNNQLSFTLQLEYPSANLIRQEKINSAINNCLTEIQKINPVVNIIKTNFINKISTHKAQQGVQLLPTIKNIIAVASGKGGVGKSTTTVNLAIAMAKEGAKVGILDADIYGPSIPQMLGLADDKPLMGEGGKIMPLLAHDLKAMSIGFMIDKEAPMIWRGPMASGALDQIINDTLWGELDYLFVDMPPGTGDIQLSLSQKVPLTGAIIVTTPQDIALIDARKGLKMFEKVGVPILGIVENMSTYICPNCQHQEAIFGAGGADKMSSDYNVEVLGQLPLSLKIREEVDSGNPSVAAKPESVIAKTYADIAHKVAVVVSQKAKSFDSKIPNIVVQNI